MYPSTNMTPFNADFYQSQQNIPMISSMKKRNEKPKHNRKEKKLYLGEKISEALKKSIFFNILRFFP